jgi:hypothetical protein
MAPKSSLQTIREPLGVYTRTDTGSVDVKDGITYAVDATMLDGKEGHYGYPDLHGVPDVGGEFRLSKSTYEAPLVHLPETICGQGAYHTHHYTGSVCGEWIGGSQPSVIPDASDYGASAYSKMKPTQPIFSGLNSIYELRELPGMLKQKLSDSGLKNIANYWLALRFGWKPLLSDIRKTVNFQVTAQKRLRQLLRDNGKAVRRKVDLASTTSDPVITTGNFGSIQPGFVTQFYRRSGMPFRKVTTVVKEHIWAAARYRYWLPEGPRDIEWKAKMYGGLYGLNPTPSVIYNAIPWSWLTDWFTNLGDVIDNLDAGVADKLAADYFYVMRQKDTIVTIDDYMSFQGLSGVWYPTSVTATRTGTTKTRLKGDPFGFGTNPNELSAVQWSILGALGISKL